MCAQCAQCAARGVVRWVVMRIGEAAQPPTRRGVGLMRGCGAVVWLPERMIGRLPEREGQMIVHRKARPGKERECFIVFAKVGGKRVALGRAATREEAEELQRRRREELGLGPAQAGRPTFGEEVRRRELLGMS